MKRLIRNFTLALERRTSMRVVPDVVWRALNNGTLTEVEINKISASFPGDPEAQRLEQLYQWLTTEERQK